MEPKTEIKKACCNALFDVFIKDENFKKEMKLKSKEYENKLKDILDSYGKNEKGVFCEKIKKIMDNDQEYKKFLLEISGIEQLNIKMLTNKNSYLFAKNNNTNKFSEEISPTKNNDTDKFSEEISFANKNNDTDKFSEEISSAKNNNTNKFSEEISNIIGIYEDLLKFNNNNDKIFENYKKLLCKINELHNKEGERDYIGIRNTLLGDKENGEKLLKIYNKYRPIDIQNEIKENIKNKEAVHFIEQKEKGEEIEEILKKIDNVFENYEYNKSQLSKIANNYDEMCEKSMLEKKMNDLLKEDKYEDLSKHICKLCKIEEEEKFYKKIIEIIEYIKNEKILQLYTGEREIPIIWTNNGLGSGKVLLIENNYSNYCSDSETQIFSFLWRLMEELYLIIEDYNIIEKTAYIAKMFEESKQYKGGLGHIPYDKILSRAFVDYCVTEDLYDKIKFEFGQNIKESWEEVKINVNNVAGSVELPLLLSKVAAYNVKVKRTDAAIKKLGNLCGKITKLNKDSKDYKNILHFFKEENKQIRVKVEELLDVIETKTESNKEQLTIKETNEIIDEVIEKIDEKINNEMKEKGKSSQGVYDKLLFAETEFEYTYDLQNIFSSK